MYICLQCSRAMLQFNSELRLKTSVVKTVRDTKLQDRICLKTRKTNTYLIIFSFLEVRSLGKCFCKFFFVSTDNQPHLAKVSSRCLHYPLFSAAILPLSVHTEVHQHGISTLGSVNFP